MPGSNVELIALFGERGSGKSEYAVPLFISYPFGVWLDMGVASDYFIFKKDNRLGISIQRSPDLKSSFHYALKGVPTHFSFQPKSEQEAKDFISYFSKNCPNYVLFIDDAQKLLSFRDNVSEYSDFLSDGRMKNQNLILCFHRLTEVSVKTRSEATQLIHMGPLQRPKDLDALYNEWKPEVMGDSLPDKSLLYKELLANPAHHPYFIKKR